MTARPALDARSLVCGLALALALPAAARAQAESAGETVDQPGIGTLTAALARIDVERQELEALGSVSLADIQVVDVASILDREDLVVYDDALARNRTAIDELQKFLATSDITIVGADGMGMTFGGYLNDVVGLRDVVAVNVSGGRVTLFVESRRGEVEGMIG